MVIVFMEIERILKIRYLIQYPLAFKQCSPYCCYNGSSTGRLLLSFNHVLSSHCGLCFVAESSELAMSAGSLNSMLVVLLMSGVTLEKFAKLI